MTKHEDELCAESDAGSDASARECLPAAAQVGREVDPVELALATALERASAAGQWAVVDVLGRELAARQNR